MIFGDSSWGKGLSVRNFLLSVYFLLVSQSFAQVVVDQTTNNIGIQEIRLNVDGNAHLQTTDLSSRYNPAPDNIPVLIETILLQNGTEIFATTRTPEIQNLHVINVLSNDELKEQVATVDNVIIMVSEPEPNGYLTLNADGSVDIAPEAPPGSCVIKYSICKKGNDTNCAEGIVTIEVMFALPVSWIDFQASEEIDGFRIIWRTAKEKNNKKYQIWRTTSQDLKEFELMGELPGIGESSAPTKYSFLDTVPCYQESVYYRIVQWDQDGNHSSSDIFKLKREDKDSRNVRIFPNPYFGGELQTFLSKGILQKNCLVSIQDNTGQYLFYKEGKIKNWADIIPSRLKDLPGGLYFVMIRTKEEQSLVKWIKN